MPLTLPQNFSDILDYRHILWKRKWTILLCTALVLLFTGYRVSRQDPLFSSNARILISYKPPSALDLEGVFEQRGWQPPRDTTPATMAILSSRALAERVIRRLNLQEAESLAASQTHSWQYYVGSLFPASFRKKVKSMLGMSPPPGGETAPEKDDSFIVGRLVDNYLMSLQIEPDETGLVVVSISGNDPQVLQEILETHLQEFALMDVELKFETSDEANLWIAKKLEEAKQRLEMSELALLKFAEEHELPPVQEAFRAPDEFGVQEEYISEYNQSLQRLQMQSKLLKELLKNPNFIERLWDTRDDSPILESLKAEFLTLSAQYKNLSLQYGPEHPKMVYMRNQIKNVKQQIREEAQRLLKSMQTQTKFYEGMIQKARADLSMEMVDLQRRTNLNIQFQALKSEADSNRRVYEQVLAKLNMVKLMGNMQDGQLMSTIKIVDRPQSPMMVGGGSKLNKLIKAGGMGFLLGVAVAFLLEFLDNVIRTPKDLERFLSLPFLGFVPRLTSVAKQKLGEKSRSFVTLLEPSSSEAESIRNVRTNLIFSFADRKNHTVMFTSPSPGEGKSTVVAQLAASISQLGKKILLVDADLRRPTLHKVMQEENLSGVSDILIGETTLEQAVHKTSIENLDFVSAGTIPPNPSELLGSDSMRQIIEEMKTRYDVVLFDSPPILPVVDAKVLGSAMDGISIVARSGQTTINSLHQAIEQMEERTIRILGIVLNHLDLEEFATQYGYSYGDYLSEEVKEEEINIPTTSS